ncbi:nitroreductase/quinone reductase family protein [Actinomadura algeriensis]|uniref:Deazaflavin-dependent oxidoreductase (Nitroreductase family) n=1 Tax=Actinomadura algeriensis TaxID=1679523 RepID=A0ABR9JXN8_9ACTN|nr:nitroreductase/quinone reductase family protein [Actinomadura algeriensis]MBE1535243.1 deazaflavin-dependent oxidoreductase (nitroreductase family) [Actinomadura algeriensis]
MNDWNRPIIEEFRANGGRVGGPFEGADLLLMTSTGAKSGVRHVTPLGYMAEDGLLFVFASNAGAPNDPAWYHNVRADPRVTVEIGTDVFDGVAIPVEGAERDRLYTLQGERVPPYAEYQRQTDRPIPVVALHRVSEQGREWAVGDELVKIHDDLRGRMAELRTEMLAVPDGRAPHAPDLGRRLREHCVAFCDVLGEHHDNEETRAFPLLAARFPGLAPVIDRLRDEHARVTGTRRAQAELVEDADSRDLAHVRAELDRMTAELDAHFAYEEAELGGVLNVIGSLWRAAPPPSAEREATAG